MRLLTASLAVIATQAQADAPNVVVDIAPLHSLVAQLMQGVSEPALLLPPGASPHDFALRPSDARALSDADLVIWMGPGLTPQLEEPIETLATGATVITILDLPGWTTLPFREDARFEDGHDHGHYEDDHDDHDHEEDGHDDHKDHDDHDHEDHDEHAHDDHDEDGHDEHEDHAHDDHEDHEEHGHEEHEDHDEHAHDDHDDHDDHGHEDHDEHDDHDHDDHGHDDHEGHAHGLIDPHAWLDTANAIRWTTDIGGTLADMSPEHADQIIENVLTTRAALNAITAEVEETLAPARAAIESGEGGFIVPHDSLQYFELAYGVPAAGAISLGDLTSPGPARLREIEDQIAETGISCILSEPQTNLATVELLMDGTDLRTAAIDPAGSLMDPGAELYGMLMRDIATALAGCVAPE